MDLRLPTSSGEAWRAVLERLCLTVDCSNWLALTGSRRTQMALARVPHRRGERLLAARVRHCVLGPAPLARLTHKRGALLRVPAAAVSVRLPHHRCVPGSVFSLLPFSVTRRRRNHTGVGRGAAHGHAGRFDPLAPCFF